MKIKDLIENLNIGEATAFDLVRDLDIGGKGNKLTIALKRDLPPEPRPPVRKESPARAHTFLDAQGLGAYLAKYGTADTVVFSDPVSETMVAVIEETAKGGFERLVMRPDMHPLWKPWHGLLAAGAVPVERFGDFVNEHRRDIVSVLEGVPDGREMALMFRQIKAAVSIERMTGKGKNAVNGLIVKTKIQGTEKNEPVELPDSFTIQVPLYVGMEAETFTIDLSVDADDSAEVKVTITAAEVAEARVRQFEALAGVVRTAMGKGMVVLGAPNNAPWTYLPEVGQQ